MVCRIAFISMILFQFIDFTMILSIFTKFLTDLAGKEDVPLFPVLLYLNRIKGSLRLLREAIRWWRNGPMLVDEREAAAFFVTWIMIGVEDGHGRRKRNFLSFPDLTAKRFFRP
ncbi:MAG: hypothetical protein CW342_04690 [Thermoactinomycetaceae bacterium]|nr:hypothetical protein [Thermoactinomycetaceae bacterium]